jgi:peptidyl-prolyl cis-trans isomerase B (cyclophilin B)
MRRLLVLLTLTALALTLAACGGGDERPRPATTGAQTGAATETTADAGTTGCRDAEQPPARDVQERKAPTFKVSKRVTYTAVLETSCGTLEIQLAASRAPKTASSFISLVREGFYDGLAFHRIVPGFVVQGGDPKGTGEGGPGYSVTEAPPEDLEYETGVVAMAKTQMEEPGTSGSQFFIVTGADAGLPPEYALVGRVTKGKDVVEKLGSVPSDPADGDRPIEPVVIEKATIRES